MSVLNRQQTGEYHYKFKVHSFLQAYEELEYDIDSSTVVADLDNLAELSH